MRIAFSKEDFSQRQLQILGALFEKEYQQKDLQKLIDTSAPNLHYHLSKLEELGLVRKETLYKVGNVKINSISLNPAARQKVRGIIGMEVEKLTLITGFGELKTGYRVPDLIHSILCKYNYPITRVICYTTANAKQKRLEFKDQENLMEIDEFVFFPYEEYRYLKSALYQSLEMKFSKEMELANIIIDITPLSKLFSLKLLEIANKYQIPCVYLGMDEKRNDKLYWLTNMKLQGKIESIELTK